MTSSAAALQSKANPQQLEAILATDGPVLIIAGPGSGKTFTLVERIVYLITQKGVAPESLFVVTFTDKAARELTTRISNRLTDLGIKFNLNEMYLGTFHSICLRLLEDFREFTRLKRSFTLFDQFDQQYFLYQHIKDFRELPDAQLVMGDDQTGRWAQSENLLKWVNKVSEEALDATTLAAAAEPEIRALANCFARYQELLHEHNSLDFSGIQYEALQLLEKRPEVLGQLREKLTYLMVDEYQDTNTIQERILLLLAGENKNLCVVGDDDQGLYRFRGATIRNILEFPALFDDGQCKQVKLTVNYRSHPDIIRFYNEWMKEQVWDDGTRVFRFAKQIVPREDDFPDMPTAVRLAASDDKGDTTNWHAEVLSFLNGLKASGRLADWNQVAFLFRSVKNDKVVALARFLEAEGVPVFSPRSNMFFEREEIRLMIGALIFLFPQFPKVRAWAEGVHLDIWDYYDQLCFKPFTDELRKPENKSLLDWARPLAKRHAVLTQNTDYAFSGLFYQLLQFPLFSRFLTEEAVQGVDKGRAARNLGTFSKLLTKFEYANTRTDEFVDIAIESFLKESGELRPEGLLPKLAFFAATIDELTGELRPAVERALLKHGIPTSRILVNVGDDKLKERVEVRVVEPPVKIKLVRVRKQYQMREKQLVAGQELMPERADKQKWGELIEKYRLIETQQDGLTAADAARASGSRTFDLTSRREKQAFSPLSLVAEVSRYLNRSPLEIEELLDATKEGTDELVAITNEFNELLYDEIIPRLFRQIYDLDESQQTEEHEVDLIKLPPNGYYEVSAAKDKIVRMNDAQIKDEERAKSFHLDTYCFDSGSENWLFWDLLREQRVKKIYFTGMLTHGQSDFFIQYIDPDSRTVRSYYPDFIFQREEPDGSLKYVIVEVKADNQIEDAVVQAKKDFAHQIAVASGMEYRILKSSDADKRHFRALL